MSPGKKLVAGAALVAGVTAYMAYDGAVRSWQYYLTADECLAQLDDLSGRRVRVSGGVAAGTLQIDARRLRAAFQLAGRSGQLDVVCDGPLPDNLGEGMDVVVEGRLESGRRLRAEKVLTRCASKYESEEQASSEAVYTADGRAGTRQTRVTSRAQGENAAWGESRGVR